MLDRVTAEERTRRRPLPEHLAKRLRQVPQHAEFQAGVDCNDTDRLYAAVRHRAHGGEADLAALEHLAQCAHCRALFDPLEAVMGTMASPHPDAPRRPMPRGLAKRLRAIPRRPRPSAWIRDSRYAAAVCYMLTGLLMLVVGGREAAAHFQSTSERLGQQTTALIAKGDAQSRAVAGLVTEVTGLMGTGTAEGRQWLLNRGSSLGGFIHTTWDTVDPRQFLTPDNTPSEGDTHGNTADDRC